MYVPYSKKNGVKDAAKEIWNEIENDRKLEEIEKVWSVLMAMERYAYDAVFRRKEVGFPGVFIFDMLCKMVYSIEGKYKTKKIWGTPIWRPRANRAKISL